MNEDARRADTASAGERCCKAGRVATKRGIRDFLDGDLAEEWVNADGPGLRTLADRFNRAVLEAALLDHGDTPLEGEVGLLYEQLTAEDGRARVERRLSDHGVDPHALREEFISYKTVDRHFKNCVDRERETKEPTTEDDAVKRIRKLNRRVETVAGKTLTELDGAAFEDPSVSVSVTVVCSSCGERKSFTDAVKDGCACDGDDAVRNASIGIVDDE